MFALFRARLLAEQLPIYDAKARLAGTLSATKQIALGFTYHMLAV